MRIHRFILAGLGTMALMMAVLTFATPVQAGAAPSIAVAPLWRPGTQLTSLDSTGSAFPIWDPGGDDYRYVDTQLFVTTTVPFWTAQLTCTVNPAVLTSYTWDDSSMSGDRGDDTPMIVWGPDWGMEGSYFVSIPDTTNPTGPSAAFNTTTGAMTFTAAPLGDRSPLGTNGVSSTLLLATLRYRVKLTAGTSPLSCTGSFLDRNGMALVAPVFTAPPALNVINGYTVTGKASYQGRTAMAGIGVQCQYDNGPTYVPATPVLTDATGKFTFTTRSSGYYKCWLWGNTPPNSTNAYYENDIYLSGATDFVLSSNSLTLLPTALRAGNVYQDGTEGYEEINSDDLTVVTTHWNTTRPANTNGDVNGDGKVDKVDLALLGINFGWREDTDAHHYVYDLPRDYDTFANSRALVGDPWTGNVTQLVAGTNRIYWATLSPNGSKLAYVQDMGATAKPQYALFTIPAAGGTALRLSATTATYDAFAPSWSPDGQRLAFICSDGYNGLWWGDRGYDQGALCFIGADGKNFTSGNPGGGNNAWAARIYPPAWLNNHEVLFGRPSSIDPSTCPADTICRFNMDNQAVSEFSTEIVVGVGEKADMPSVDVNNNILIYRFDDGTGDVRLRYAEMDPDSDWSIPAWHNMTSPPSPYHVDVSYWDGAAYQPVSTDVGYYSLWPMDKNIVFQDFNGGNGGDAFTNVMFDWDEYNTPGMARWQDPYYNMHWVNFASWNPFWDGDTANWTDLFSLRNTVSVNP